MHLQPTGEQGATLAPLFLHNQPTNQLLLQTHQTLSNNFYIRPTGSISDSGPAEYGPLILMGQNSREQRRNTMNKSAVSWAKRKGNKRGGRQGRKEEQGITKSREQRIGEQSLPQF